MSDLAVLGVVLTALYLSECVVWSRRHALLLVGRGWPFGAASLRALAPAGLGNSRGVFVPLNPLPPFSRAFVVEPWPFSAGSGGVLGFASSALGRERSPQTERLLTWEQAATVERDGKRLVHDGKTFTVSSSEAHAAAAHAALLSLSQTPAAARTQAIADAVWGTFNVDAIAARAALVARSSRALWASSVLLFLFLFAAVPVEVSQNGLSRWPLLLGGLYGGVVVTAALFAFAHRRLNPTRTGERVTQLLLLLPAPTMAIRAPDALSKHALAAAHPAAAVLALVGSAADRDATKAALAPLWRDLRHPRLPLPAAQEKAAVESEHRAVVVASVRRACAAVLLDVSELEAPPAPEAGCVAYCPRCHAQYKASASSTPQSCSDCGGVLLLPLS